jgi:MATE family multidrug resistance protein
MVGIVYMFGIAVGTATGVLTAQAVGARDSVKARQTGFAGMVIMVAVSASLGAAILLGAPGIAQVYTKDAAVQKLAAQLLVFVAFYELFDTLQLVIVNALRGYKIAVVPMLVYTVALWGIGLGGGYTLGLTRLAGADSLGLATPMGVTGFWLAGVASLVVSSLILLAYFTRAARLTRLAD